MSKRTAVVIEDDPSAQRIVEALLQNMGFEVRVVDDGRVAVDVVTRQPPDLVCLDLGLPNISGYDVCEEIRNHPTSAHVPILVTTGHRTPQRHGLALQLGADAYLVKPFARDEFNQVVRSLLAKPQPAQSEPPQLHAR